MREIGKIGIDFIYEHEKYKCDSVADVKEKLEEFGVAVLPAVLNDDECQRMKDGMWDYLEHITSKFELPISRKDPKSWRELPKLFPKHSMLIQQWSIGHAHFIWELRQNPKILRIFSELWSVPEEQLIVSFDGASFHMPPEKTNLGWFRGTTWFHTDQSYTRNDFECVQSWATAYDVDEGDATLAFLEGSHKFHAGFAKEFSKSDKSDWYKLGSAEELEFYKSRGCLQRYIKCPAGSLVFWDSRTIHCGQEAIPGRKKSNHRCVAYLCYSPRNMATEAILRKRIKAFEELRTTNHYPYKPKLFPKNPRTYGAPLPVINEITPPVLSEIGRRLVGYR